MIRSLPLSLAPRVRRLASLVAAAGMVVLTAAQSAGAQSAPPEATLRFDGAGALAFTSPYGSPDVGRLTATYLSLPSVPGANQAVDVFCVDLLHNVTFDPAGWNVYMTNLGGASIAYTRQGTQSFTTGPDALTRYRKAAWLVDQFAGVTSLTDTAGIQGATWLQFVPTLAPYDYARSGASTAGSSCRGSFTARVTS